MNSMLESGKDGGPSHDAARAARASFEEALFTLRDIPVDFDRAGMRDRILRAIAYAYTAIDNPVIATAHLDGLTQAAAAAAESRAVLARVGDPEADAALKRALTALASAETALRGGAEHATSIQLARRHEIVGGRPAGSVPAATPFRASIGLPSLHAVPRGPVLPHVAVEPAEPKAAPAAPPVVPPKPETFEELAAFAASAGTLADRYFEPEAEEAAEPPPPVPAFEPAIEEIEVLRRLGRDCLEDLANHRNLRKANALEGWMDQAPFEQRLLDSLDAFAAVAGAALPMVSIFHAEAKQPDPERAFAAALALGSIAGQDTVDAAVMTLKQSAPEEHGGWIEGFALAPNPAIDAAMAELCRSARPDLVAVALDVLHARGRTPDEVVAALLDRAEPPIATRVARALATALPRHDAIDRLERICAATPDDDLFFAALESLLRRGHGPAVDLLRSTIDAVPVRARRALPLLCVVGRASDLDRLLAAAHEAPTVPLLRGLGRFGHVDSLGPLLGFLQHDDAEVVAAAAEALDRISGAGLRAIVEEPWEIELPPEAADAGALPVPTRKVERVVTDPAQWSAWVRDHARRLDAKLKTRGGAPFGPTAIVAELEAHGTPADRREEAALELALVTGIASPFSPYDWVARQRMHLAELRDQVAAAGIAPGAWSIRAHRHEGVAIAPASARPSSSTPAPEIVAPAFTAATMPSFTHEPPAPAAAAKPKKADLGSTVSLSLPTHLLQSLAQGVLPFQRTNTSTGATPVSRTALTNTGLPFHANAAAPTKLSLEQYASLCAELAVFPHHVETIFQRYGLAEPHDRTTENASWQERLRRNPAEHQEWHARYQTYLAYWTDQARNRGPAR